jgi:CHAT domain-containing protein
MPSVCLCKRDSFTHSEARQRYRRALALQRQGQFAAALVVAKQALQRLGDVESLERTEAFLLVGLLCCEHGDHYRRARERLQRARELLAQTHGRDHPLYGVCLRGLAGLEEDRGSFAAAEKLYRQALDVFEKAHGERSVEYARTLRALGRMFATWWIWDAEGICLRALQIREQVLGKDHPDCAENLTDLGLVSLQCKHLHRAVKLLRSAVAMQEKALGKDHPALAETLNHLGQVHVESCEYTQARVCHRRALLLNEQARGQSHLHQARYLTAFAWLCADVESDGLRARRLLRRAVAIRRELGCARHPEQAWSLCLLGYSHDAYEFSASAADFPQAEKFYEQALALFESIPAGRLLPTYAYTLSRAANVHYWSNYRLKPIDHAARLADRCHEAIKKQQAGHKVEEHPFYRYYLYARTILHAGRQERDSAESLAQRAVEVVRRRSGHEQPNELHQSLGTLLSLKVRHGKHDEAWPLIAEMLQVEDRLARELSGQAERSRLAFLKEFYAQALYYALTNATAQPGRLAPVQTASLYDHVLRFRGLVGARQAEDRLAFDRPELRARLAALHAARRRLVQHVLSPPEDEQQRERWLEEMERRTDAKEDVEADLAEACRPFLANRDLLKVSSRDVRQRIPEGAVLVDFIQYVHFLAPPPGRAPMVRDPRLGAFVLRRDRPAVYVPLGSAQDIRKSVDAWREAVAAFRTGENGDLDGPARELARQVWQPLAEHFHGARTVLVAPDGPVCFLPFAALPGKRPGSYLIDEYTIGYLPSARWLVDRLRPSAARTRAGLLGIGGIDYGRRPQIAGRGAARKRAATLFEEGDWGDLPGTAPEVTRVRELFTPRKGRAPVHLLKGTVTKDKLLEELQQRWQYIHYAGHGYFTDKQAAQALIVDKETLAEDNLGLSALERLALSRNQLLLSGLVLSGVNHARTARERGDAILTAEEVGGLDLRGTKLVVLSACDTGLGSVAGGEGVLGLQRAFLTAGADSLVTSLWKVDDDATALLMEEFYKNLWGPKKLPRLEALRRAQRTVMRQPVQLVPNRGLIPKPLPTGGSPRPAPSRAAATPVLWAAFVLSGDWN